MVLCDLCGQTALFTESSIFVDLLFSAGLKALKDGTEIVERMLKALIKSLENKHLNPGPLGPFLKTYWTPDPSDP